LILIGSIHDFNVAVFCRFEEINSALTRTILGDSPQNLLMQSETEVSGLAAAHYYGGCLPNKETMGNIACRNHSSDHTTLDHGTA
jgi:hypothetical protein